MKDSGLQVLECGFLVSGTWISDSNRSRIPDFWSCITDSEAQDPDSISKKFPDSANLDYFTWGDIPSVSSKRGHETKKTCSNRVQDMTCFAANI